MTQMLSFPVINGLISAPFTAFHADEQVNLDAISQQCQFLVDDGVVGAFICGTTGEGLSLTLEERISIAERWMQVAPPDFKVIVHIGHNSLGDAQALASHAAQIGAYGIAGFSPFFFKVHSPTLLAELCAEIAASAPDLPFFYYHIPSLTGIQMSMRSFLAAAHGKISNLAGIKYSHTDLMDLRLCRAYADGQYQVMFGCDEMLLSALVLGVTGAVGSTYNYAAPIYHKVIAAYEASDMDAAHRWQFLAMQMVEILARYGNGTTFGKVVLKHLGVDCGPCRIPLQTHRSEQEAEIIRELEAIDFWNQLKLARSVM